MCFFGGVTSFFCIMDYKESEYENLSRFIREQAKAQKEKRRMEMGRKVSIIILLALFIVVCALKRCNVMNEPVKTDYDRPSTGEIIF